MRNRYSRLRQRSWRVSSAQTDQAALLAHSPAQAERPRARRLKESAQEGRRCIRDADDLVRCLTIEFEIELALGLAVLPVGKVLEFAAPQRPLHECGAPDGDADARRLPRYAALLGDRLDGGDHAARHETLPALVLTREQENRVTFGDMLAAIHRL